MMLIAPSWMRRLTAHTQVDTFIVVTSPGFASHSAPATPQVCARCDGTLRSDPYRLAVALLFAVSISRARQDYLVFDLEQDAAEYASAPIRKILATGEYALAHQEAGIAILRKLGASTSSQRLSDGGRERPWVGRRLRAHGVDQEREIAGPPLQRSGRASRCDAPANQRAHHQCDERSFAHGA